MDRRQFITRSAAIGIATAGDLPSAVGNTHFAATNHSPQSAMPTKDPSAGNSSVSVVIAEKNIAVVLKYDAAGMSVPTIIAKGKMVVAQEILELAAEHGVLTLEMPSLARSLYGTVAVGDPVSAELYAAVVEVMAYAYQLNRYKTSGEAPPLTKLPVGAVPEALDFGDDSLTRDPRAEAHYSGIRWHKVLAHVNLGWCGFNHETDLDHWPELPGLPLSIGKFTVAPLTMLPAIFDMRDRIREIVKYLNWCLLDDGIVLFIRTQEGDIRSVAEVYVDVNDHHPGKLRARMAQHSSLVNGEPDDDCKVAMEAALEMLSRDSMQWRLREIKDFHNRWMSDPCILVNQMTDPGVVAMMCVLMNNVLPHFEDGQI